VNRAVTPGFGTAFQIPLARIGPSLTYAFAVPVIRNSFSTYPPAGRSKGEERYEE
jgi:hypothetical protein